MYHRQCLIELSNLVTLLLIKLKDRLSESSSREPQYTAFAVEDGPLKQRLALQHLHAKAQPTNKGRKLQIYLRETLHIKEEIASNLTGMERLKSLVSIALEMYLSLVSPIITKVTRRMLIQIASSYQANVDTLHIKTQTIKDDTYLFVILYKRALLL